MTGNQRLDAEQLAAATGSSLARLGELVAAGILRPGSEGEFGTGDVQRVLVTDALEEAGLTLELLRRGIEAGVVSFEATGVLYPDPGPLGPTVGELADDLGLEPGTLVRVITAFGMPQPGTSTRLHEPDAAQLRAFVSAWRRLGDDELLVRAARGYGDALRRAAESWMGLYADTVLAPLGTRTVPWEEMRTTALEPGLDLLSVGRSMLPWLIDHHLFRLLNQLNFDSIERQLATLGITPARPARPSAIVFTDLAGYTRLTEERGDEAAAASAIRLAALADEIARRHGGGLVKLLGDGVMLHFPTASDALAAAIELRDAMAPAGLPAAHTGIHLGGVIRRESDFFGRTVNIAARLAAEAGPGQILVTDDVVEALGSAESGLPRFVALTPLTLKGIVGSVSAHLVQA